MTVYLGLMSGTSLDGVDIVAVRLENDQVTLLGSYFESIPEQLRRDTLSIANNNAVTAEQLGELDHKLGYFFADAINHAIDTFPVKRESIAAIGSHGQTVCHQPEKPYPFTMQLGDPNLIAVKTKITVVADFRRKDMAYGGQGAPLVPAFHQHIFSKPDTSTVILNIGGIANITVLNPDNTVFGYDTGPGNMLMDHWIFNIKGERFDKNGQFATSGKSIPSLLHNMLQDSYFSQTAPKSTGREYFNAAWIKQHLDRLNQQLRPEDVQATLLALTVQTCADEIAKFGNGKVYVCGGGAHNSALTSSLSLALPNWTISSTAEVNIDPDYLEAMAFAWLAHCALNQIPANVPEVTGASQKCVLGAIYPAG
ncbi:anhydro-N-acetylmuramic acid kinase [Veronia pacifica]|uniref:Anhydro-N-acetylmuramic acid kinase n=1 Tax=Veronia pacifica TaxID=1080227 RepID=A0A1C3EPA9_9GAMM|nr:anhydro-N-acetylmuramic acid kinase [Veronia pacifica]ODA35080.1 anhydro-N-acetylmuramic acid kinase [Veronia pacifica]